MDAKQFKNLKEGLNQKLYTMFRDLIQGGDIKTAIHDDLENMELTVFQVKESGNNRAIVETIFYFSIIEPDNLRSKSNNRTTLFANNDLTGVVSDYAQIDLTTMNTIRDKFYEFCADNNLIDTQNGDGVGVIDESTPEL